MLTFHTIPHPTLATTWSALCTEIDYREGFLIPNLWYGKQLLRCVIIDIVLLPT